jgi:hypothetical protein
MKELNINITRAAISSFSVQLTEKKVVVSATIALLTEGNKRITDYTISSEHWEKEKAFTLPPLMIEPIKNIMAQLEEIVVNHCANRQAQLEAELNGK